jgi:hypothetical protein
MWAKCSNVLQYRPVQANSRHCLSYHEIRNQRIFAAPSNSGGGGRWFVWIV